MTDSKVVHATVTNTLKGFYWEAKCPFCKVVNHAEIQFESSHGTAMHQSGSIYDGTSTRCSHFKSVSGEESQPTSNVEYHFIKKH